MAREQEKESTGAKSRYVWDPQKLAWVETVEEPPKEEPARETTRRRPVQAKTVVESPREEVVEEVSAEPEPVEAVVEAGALQYKGAWLRLAAIFVDLIILTIVMIIVNRIVAAAGAENLPKWVACINLLVGFVYFVGLWSWRGQTFGKMLVGAKIVKIDGSRIGFGNAVLRYSFYLVPTFAPLLFAASFFIPRLSWIAVVFSIIGFIIVGISAKKRGIHDLVAGTCVINNRVIAPQPGRAGYPDTNEPGPDKQE